MKWFGKRWNAMVCFEEEKTQTPIGVNCVYCTKPIKRGNRGVVLPANWRSNHVQALPYHLACFVEMLGADKESLSGLPK